MGQEFIERVVGELKEGRIRGLDAIELAELAKQQLGAALGPISVIAVFRSAFGIPLDVLQRAQAWRGFAFGGNAISDEEFKELVEEWMPSEGNSN